MHESYLAELREVAVRLQDAGASVHISGEGAGAFLFVQRGPRGFELYRGTGSSVVIDPADGDQLLGEVVLPSYAEAIATGLRWLDRGRAA